MKSYMIAFAPPVLLALLLAMIFWLPKHNELLDSAISPDLPLGATLSSWYGEKQQESKVERQALAADTIFSKARYDHRLGMLPSIHASIVYSGDDMNSSIHRPERCLPSQGHYNILGAPSIIEIPSGRELRFTRLSSSSVVKRKNGENARINHITYYVFIGHSNVCSNHMGRTLQDILDRILLGTVQRWAYLQVGTYWSAEFGISKEASEANLRALISEILPQVVDWDSISDSPFNRL